MAEQENRKIGTYNGVDFYTSLDAMLKDGEKLLKIDNRIEIETINMMTKPRISMYGFEDTTGVIKNLWREKRKAYEEALKTIAKDIKEPSYYSIIAMSEDESPAIVNSGYRNGSTMQNTLGETKEGYRKAWGMVSVPYTLQLIEPSKD